MIYALQDLKPHLVCCGGDQFFVTSDNPVFRYNQYCEGLGSSLGANSKGLQIFFPLSPSLLLVLYDGSVYKVGHSDFMSGDLPDEDIDSLNGMQVVNADENLYFSNWENTEKARDLFERFKARRRRTRVEVDEFVDVEDEEASLLKLAEVGPNLGLRLSFVGLRRDARRVKGVSRLRMQRKEIPDWLMPRATRARAPREVGGRRRRIFHRLPPEA